jgi:hypothetical protein
MIGMKKISANIMVSLYDGEFAIEYACSGEERCNFAICSIMPPDGTAPCAFVKYGGCLSQSSQTAALVKLKERITKALKDITEEVKWS